MNKNTKETILEIKNLAKNYGEAEILQQINLNVHAGEVVVILGPSGCGKSTFLRCLNGLETIQGGEVFLKGEKLHTPETRWTDIRQRIGMVFQSYELFPHMTIMENIMLAPVKVQGRPEAEVRRQAEALLARVGLLEKQAAWPAQLSGGQKQRVAIVRALCMQPEIMLFDEVTASLDPEMVREVLDVMLELAKDGMTMLIVTHEMGFARAAADRILFMEAGKIIEENTPDAFFTQPETQRAQKFLDIFAFDPATV